jgi:ketosteroid isomerase-like protein
MNISTRLLLILIGTAFLAVADAQDSRDDAADVLLTIEREWEATRKGDQDKIDDMLIDEFMGWNRNSPAPRTKASTSDWARFGEEMGRMLKYEIYPLSITVHGDVAVAHYLYASAFKNKKGDIEMSNGRYTDTLVRTENGWKFIAWHGGKDD